MSREHRDRVMHEVALAVRTEQNTVDLVDEHAAHRLGINRTDLRCLDILEREGRLTAGRLAELSGLTTGAVTALVDRLERAGYVRRRRDPGDRRRVLVEITPKARKAATEVYGPIGEHAMEVLAGYTDEQLAFLREHYRRGTEFLQEHIRRLAETPSKRRKPRHGS